VTAAAAAQEINYNKKIKIHENKIWMYYFKLIENISKNYLTQIG